jgi:hypothetical protein
LNGLAAVGDGSSADGDNEISVSGSRRLRCLDYGGPRRMRGQAIERAGAAVAERSADLVDLIRVSIKRVAYHQEDTCRSQAVDLGGYRLGRRLAKYDLVHLTEEYASRRRHMSLLLNVLRSLLAAPRLCQVGQQRANSPR